MASVVRQNPVYLDMSKVIADFRLPVENDLEWKIKRIKVFPTKQNKLFKYVD